MNECCIKTDSGNTKSKELSLFCLYFALGKCFKENECPFKNQLPQGVDEKHLGVVKDVFRREKYLTKRGDRRNWKIFKRK